MSNLPEIEPCPFCLDSSHESYLQETPHYGHYVQCDCGSRNQVFSTKKQAIESWNSIARRNKEVIVPEKKAPFEIDWTEIVEARGCNLAIEELKRLNPWLK